LICRFAVSFVEAGCDHPIRRHQLEIVMSKLRHLAILVLDPEASATFFETAFGMTRAGTARRGVYMSDGVMNVALLKVDPEKEKVGLFHYGMWVDDLDEAEKVLQSAGASYLGGRPESPKSHYEAKYRDPNGIVFDITHTGWAGAVKDPAAAK
jgi:lactoylglutathione lyase